MPPTQFSLLAGPVGQKGEPGPSVSTHGLLELLCIFKKEKKSQSQVVLFIGWLAFVAYKDSDYIK